MTERESLIRAIVAAPEDDTLRLAFADWLDETGGKADAERALWIREPEAQDRTDLNLWAALHLFDGDDLGLPMSTGGCRVRRGFLEHVELPLGWFMTVAKKLFAKHPVKSVRLSGRVPLRRGPRTEVWYARSDSHIPGDRLDGSVSPWLPNLFRHHLKAHRNPRTTRRGGRYHRFTYATPNAAYEDLDAACVRYGRWLNGLPQLDAAKEVPA